MSNEPAMNGATGKLLIFRLHGSLYALDLAQTAEVCDPTTLWPIPLAPPYYSGAMNFHGNIIAVMDLALFLGLAEINDNRHEKLIIVNQDIASLAFLIDSIVRIVTVDETSFTPSTTTQFTVSKLTLPEGEALQLDLTGLIKKAERDMQKNGKNNFLST